MLVSPALQRGEKGFHKFVTESRRDGAGILFMREPIAPAVCFSCDSRPFSVACSAAGGMELCLNKRRSTLRKLYRLME